MKNITGKEAGESGWNAIWERKRQAKEHARRLKSVRGLVRHRKEGNTRKKSKKCFSERCGKTEWKLERTTLAINRGVES